MAARIKNPALAQQAEQLLPIALQHLKELYTHRKRLVLAVEMETYLSTHENKLPSAPPALPRYLR